MPGVPALNYSPDVRPEHDDGSCVYVVSGCMDNGLISQTAINEPGFLNTFSIQWWSNNGNTHNYSSSSNAGTVYPATPALNYNSSATVDDNLCVYPLLGCNDTTSPAVTLTYGTSWLSSPWNYSTTNITGQVLQGGGAFYNAPGALNVFPFGPLQGQGFTGTTTEWTYDNQDACCFKAGCIDSTAYNFDLAGFSNNQTPTTTPTIDNSQGTVCADCNGKIASQYFGHGGTNGSGFVYDQSQLDPPQASANSCCCYQIGCTDPAACNYDANNCMEDPSNPCKYDRYSCGTSGCTLQTCVIATNVNYATLGACQVACASAPGPTGSSN